MIAMHACVQSQFSTVSFIIFLLFGDCADETHRDYNKSLFLFEKPLESEPLAGTLWAKTHLRRLFWGKTLTSACNGQ